MNTLGKKSTLYKNSAQSNLMTSYIFNTSLPLMKNNEKSINYFEPKLSFKFNPNNVKNNNTLKRTIDMNNIYNDNRLALDNSLEGGDSLTIGFDFKKNKITSKNDVREIEDFLELKMATVFRNKEEVSIPQNSTLNKKKSNIFGQLNYKVNSIFSVNYDFSIKDDLNTIEYSSLDTIFDSHNFRTQFNFLQKKGVMGNTDVLENKTKYNFDELNSLSFSTRRNRNLNLTEYYDLIYEYKNDCLIAGIQYKKNYYNDADIKPVEELFFSITLIPLTTFSPDKMILK
jgi:LPS-assembly protein